MIVLKNVSKTYATGSTPFQALKNVSLRIDPGEFIAIMGPSGSGKSTLMHIIGFLDNPDEGEYWFRDVNTALFTDTTYALYRKHYIGFVFQQFHLLPRMSAKANVSLPLIYTGLRAMAYRAIELMTQVGLASKTENFSNEMSGGEKQRVAIARALMNDPQIIFADEPTGNLDSKSETDIMNLFTTLNKQGKTVIVVTHEESVATYAKRVIRLRDGQIVSDQQKEKRASKLAAPVFTNIVQEKYTFVTRLSQALDYVKQSYAMILSNKVRSFLSMLGVMIGVATVVAMLVLGAGAKQSITDSLSRLGTNMLTLRPDGHNDQIPIRLSQKDVDLISKLSTVQRVAAKVNGQVTTIVGNKNLSSSVEGNGIDAAKMRNYTPDFGRFFNEEDVAQRNKVAVIGRTVARELFGTTDPLNKLIKLNRISFTVIGVLAPMGGNSFRDQDNIVIVPVTTAMHRLLGKKYYDSVDIQIKSPELMDQAQDQIKQLMIRQHNLQGERATNAFRIMNMAEIQDTFNKTADSLSFLLSFIGSLALLVGGIGIMNIMLVSVTERIREIGLRKAIGARKPDILFQFVVEAVMMTFTGGLIGILLGIGLGAALAQMAGWTIKITMSSITIAATFSILIGLVFGIWPAKKASDLSPIDALRYE